METEAFSFRKLFLSFFQFLPWVKTFSIGTRLVLVIFLLWFGWQKLIVKPQEQKQTIVVQKGGNAVINQNQESKKKWSIFVEPWIGISTRDKGEWESGIRLGARF